MKFILLFILCIYSCSISDNGKVEATLRVTVYKSKIDPSKSLLLFTTFYHNKTGKDIYFIKSYPWYRHFLKKNLDGSIFEIPNPELHHLVRNDCVNEGNYLKRIIYSVPDKKKIVDFIAELNKASIKTDYNGYKEKFSSQFLVLRAGERLEIDNTPIYDNGKSPMEYEFLEKPSNELDRRNKYGDNLKIPKNVGRYIFWDGEIKLDSQEIEVVFKEI